jgi:hypothetical protein
MCVAVVQLRTSLSYAAHASPLTQTTEAVKGTAERPTLKIDIPANRCAAPQVPREARS